MTTEYRVVLDRETCDGIFACLVRDGRFAEADDGLATFDGVEPGDDDALVATFEDDAIEDAQQAASACPVDAIEVTEVSR
ncbi:ferredoxin [Halovenus salina]|uniref:Ferredoxin n=1 Tax=Halovenus salina TaxID=1510225 RepID=A0ABD5W6X8_9EURY|nr:ferredoxin [Halovenus salina]